MAQIFSPSHPPNDPRECAPWLNKELRRIGRHLRLSTLGLAAVARGEAPDGSGNPLPIPNLADYWFKPGVGSFGVAYGEVRAAGEAVISSTAHTTKGLIKLGAPTAIVTVDEANSYVGINTETPAVALDVVGSANGTVAGMTPSSDISPSWAPGAATYYTGAGTPIGHADAHSFACASDDGNTSYIAHLAAGSSSLENGSDPDKQALNGTVVPGTVYRIHVKLFTLGVDLTGPTASGYLRVDLVDSAGKQWSSGSISILGLTTTPTQYTLTVTCSGTEISSGNTPNAIWLFAGGLLDVNSQIYVCCSYLTVLGNEDLTHWHTAGGTLVDIIDSAGQLGIGTGSDALSAMATIKSAGTVNVAVLKSTTASTVDLTINNRAVMSAGRIKTAVLFTDDNATIASARLAGLSTSLVAPGATRTLGITDRDGNIATDANVTVSAEGDVITVGGDIVLS